MTETKFIACMRFLQDHWPDFASSFGTIGLTLGSVILPQPFLPFKPTHFFEMGTIICLGSVVLLIFGIIFSAIRRTGMTKLKSENADLRKLLLGAGRDPRQIWRYHLWILSTAFELGSSDRVSLYKPDEGRFIMLGRFSENPALEVNGRGEYPLNEGCIGKAYRSGKAVELDLPDPISSPDEYYSQMEMRCNISRATMEKCKMKSRSYVVLRLKDAAGLNTIAVIVFESLENNGLDPLELEEGIRGMHGKKLSTLIGLLQPLEPSISLTKNLGL